MFMIASLGDVLFEAYGIFTAKTLHMENFFGPYPASILKGVTWIGLCWILFSNWLLGTFIVMLTTDPWFRQTPQTNQLEIQCFVNSTHTINQRACAHICGGFMSDNTERSYALLIILWILMFFTGFRVAFFDVTSNPAMFVNPTSTLTADEMRQYDNITLGQVVNRLELDTIPPTTNKVIVINVNSPSVTIDSIAGSTNFHGEYVAGKAPTQIFTSKKLYLVLTGQSDYGGQVYPSHNSTYYIIPT